MRKDGNPDGRGVGFYFRNITEMILFGVRGITRPHPRPGRRQVNMIETRKCEHSRKPNKQHELIETCSPGPYLALFARGERANWEVWGIKLMRRMSQVGRCKPTTQLLRQSNISTNCANPASPIGSLIYD